MSSFMSRRQWLRVLPVRCVNKTLVTKHCYTTESEYKYFTVCVRTGMPVPVGQLCVCCSSINLVKVLKISWHERQENQLHCFRALKAVITANYCQELCWFLLNVCEFFSGLWKMNRTPAWGSFSVRNLETSNVISNVFVVGWYFKCDIVLFLLACLWENSQKSSSMMWVIAVTIIIIIIKLVIISL